LEDRYWQETARRQLSASGRLLADLLTVGGLKPTGGCVLFQWCPAADAARRHELLARQGILTRLFDDPPGLRFGLPGSAPASERLERALSGRQTG
jgi:histidinol-phosphate/aromatic aminotransferase/cobyric acid decarboxylase-like protein